MLVGLVVVFAGFAEARVGVGIDGMHGRVFRQAGGRLRQVLCRFDADLCGIREAQRQGVAVDEQFHRIAERGVFDKFDVGPGDETHIQEMLAQGACAADSQDDGMAADRKFSKCHRLPLIQFAKMALLRGYFNPY